MNFLIQNLGLLINAALIATPPLLLAALGSCFSERSGVVNIGIEGMMTIGAVTGAIAALTTKNGILAFIIGGLAGAVFGLIHAVVCIHFHALPFLWRTDFLKCSMMYLKQEALGQMYSTYILWLI